MDAKLKTAIINGIIFGVLVGTFNFFLLLWSENLSLTPKKVAVHIVLWLFFGGIFGAVSHLLSNINQKKKAKTTN